MCYAAKEISCIILFITHLSILLLLFFDPRTIKDHECNNILFIILETPGDFIGFLSVLISNYRRAQTPAG